MFTLAEIYISKQEQSPTPLSDYQRKKLSQEKPLMSLVTIFFYNKAHFYTKVWPRAMNFIGQSII